MTGRLISHVFQRMVENITQQTPNKFIFKCVVVGTSGKSDLIELSYATFTLLMGEGEKSE